MRCFDMLKEVVNNVMGKTNISNNATGATRLLG